MVMQNMQRFSGKPGVFEWQKAPAVNAGYDFTVGLDYGNVSIGLGLEFLYSGIFIPSSLTMSIGLSAALLRYIFGGCKP